MKYCICQIMLILTLLPAIVLGQIKINTNANSNVFVDKPLAAPGIHVESLAIFNAWKGGAIPQGNYKADSILRERLGTVAFSSDLKIHIDIIHNLVHFPSTFELIDARTGSVLGKYEVFSASDSIWYFSGNGNAYLNQTHLSLCGPRYTRKISQRGRAIVEVTQPLVYIGAEADVQSTTQLFESPTSQTVVATVVEGSKVTVLGLLPGRSDFFSMGLLVKTPFGLTGWHMPRDKLGDGRISIYQCN